MSRAEQVGQLLMVAVSSGGIRSSQAAVLSATKAGSVLLLGNSTAGAAAIRTVVSRVRQATVRPGGVKTMLAADQEGGLVQRLKGPGFSVMPSATQQAQSSDSRLTANMTIWGRQLRAAGIDADLAPVADVVPADLVSVNAPIGQLHRGYGPKPSVVAAKVSDVVAGMNAAGVATSVKHFPGLGRVRGNTDFTAHVVDSTTTRHDPALAGFAGGVRAGVDMVMVSSAFYSKIDADRRAAFSPTVIGGMIRGDLGFTGVVISDDLAAAAMRDLTPGDRVLRFLRAGGDLAIVGDPAMAGPMATAIVSAAKADPAFAQRVAQSATRVVTMKARRGLATCS